MRFRCGKNGKLVKHRHAVFGVAATLVVCLVGATALGARPARRPPKPVDKGPIHRFLVSNGVPIDAPIRVAKVSAVIQTRSKVRSVVKIIGAQSVPHPNEIEQIRKIIEMKRLQGFPIRLVPKELELLRQNVLSGELIEFHPSEKLGELELFFSQSQSLKIEIGHDIFVIKVGDKYCCFRSPSLRSQLDNILEPREVTASEGTTSGGGGGRSPRKTAR